MNRLRVHLANTAAKFVKWMLRISGKKGTTLPGKVALSICPTILAHYGEKLQGNVVLITGTNGKTTTSNLLTQFLRADGRNVISNSLGANLIQGIVSALIDGYDKSKPGQTAVIEVDEATISKVIEPLQPCAVLVTNFFSDQLDRFGTVETVVKFVEDALNKAPLHTRIVLNADDPLVSSIAPQKQNVTWYGVNSSTLPSADAREGADGKYCRECGTELAYTRYHYGQLGFYRCHGCGFKRAKPDFAVEHVRLHEGGIQFSFNGQTGFISSPSLYNVYNASAALTAAHFLGVNRDVLSEQMTSLSTGLGRMERLDVSGKPVLLTLVKNTTGCNQVLTALQQDEHPSYLVVVLNDRAADGTDISWIEQTNFEKLRTFSRLERIWATGTRAADMGTRLEKAGLGRLTKVVDGDALSAVDQALTALPDGYQLYILSTYTSLYAIRDHLLAQERVPTEG